MKKSKLLMVSFIALFTLAFALTTVNAHTIGCPTGIENDFACITDVEVNGISLDDDFVAEAVAGIVSDTVPVVVKFTAKETATDVRVKVYIEGFIDEIEEETPRFHVLEGNTYVKRFTLKLPSSMDLDELTEEELALLVRISARGKESLEAKVLLEVQRDFQSLNILSIEREEIVNAGDTLAVNVVVENNGFERLDDVFVRASIPGLGISKKVYAGDLAPTRDLKDDDINDARERSILLNIPVNTTPGNYELVVEVYNYDASTKETVRVVVRAVETRILPPVTTKTLSPGGETTFDVVLVNPSNRLAVFSIVPQQTAGFFVEASEPLVTVPAGSSKTTQVKVIASSTVEEGTHVITVLANSESGMSETVTLTANVRKEQAPDRGIVPPTSEVSPTVVITVILVIVFIVLLIILIVLLTRRPEREEEFGETSYY